MLKGILFGLLSLFILELGTMSVLSGFYNVNIWHYEVFPYYALLVVNAIIAGLLGIGIAKKLKNVRRCACILNIIIIVIIISGYTYFVWYRFSHNI